jgi:hypothetical protein
MNKRRLTLLVTMIVIVVAGCWEERAGTTCSIDGQPPQWRGQRSGTPCEFFHYSDVERKTRLLLG